MGVKWSADLRITFELKDGQPERIAPAVLSREVRRFQQAIEQGGGIFVLENGVKAGSANVQVLDQGPREGEASVVQRPAIDEAPNKHTKTAR